MARKKNLKVAVQRAGLVLAFLTDQGKVRTGRIPSERKAANTHQINKETKFRDYDTIDLIVKTLYDLGYITKDHTDPKPRGGKPSTFYKITDEGLLFLFSIIAHYGYTVPVGKEERTIRELQMSKVAQDFKSALPTVFEIWPLIVKNGIESQAEKHLFNTVSRVIQNPESWFSKTTDEELPIGSYGIPSHNAAASAPVSESPSQSFISTMVEHFFFDLTNVLGEAGSEADKERWLQALRADKALREPFITRLIREKQVAENVIRFANAYINDLEGHQRIDPETKKKLVTDTARTMSL